MAAPKQLYALSLSSNKWYIGHTASPEKCLEQICAGEGPAWTRIHPPANTDGGPSYEELFPPKNGDALELEKDCLVKQYMLRYGIHNVRGGSYCKVALEPHMVKVLETELARADRRCQTCGGFGHTSYNCWHRNKPPTAKQTAAKPSSHKLWTVEEEAYLLEHLGPDGQTLPTKDLADHLGRSKNAVNSRIERLRAAVFTISPEETSGDEDPAEQIDKGCCARCGRTNHQTANCYARTTKEGFLLV